MTAGDLLPATTRAERCRRTRKAARSRSSPMPRRCLSPSSGPRPCSPCCTCPPGCCSRSGTRVSNPRRAWQRFVAVRIPAADALPMEPLLLPDAITLIDRHYNSLMPYRPNRPNLYAVRHGAHLTLRYVDFVSNRLVLRPHNIAFPVDLIEVDPGEPPSDLIAGPRRADPQRAVRQLHGAGGTVALLGHE
jgi:hypothetical protein